jgi:hypothetical protein
MASPALALNDDEQDLSPAAYERLEVATEPEIDAAHYAESKLLPAILGAKFKRHLLAKRNPSDRREYDNLVDFLTDFVRNADINPWGVGLDKQGRVFYWNRDTRESVWDHPLEPLFVEMGQEARNTPFCPLQEKFHTFVVRGLSNISEAP